MRSSRKLCGVIGRRSLSTHMMKPLITKKTSTPAAPIGKGSPAFSAAWNTTTARAAKARRYWMP
jgi:hypothetical protein